MSAAKDLLASLSMDIYDPAVSPSKAFEGVIGEPHVFLGYILLPDIYPPSYAARKKLMARVQKLISQGQRAIIRAVTDRALTSQDRCYAQTLVAIDYAIRGWRGSFQSSNCPEEFAQLDSEIDRRLRDFRSFFLEKLAKRNPAQQRRALRVQLLTEKEYVRPKAARSLS